MMANLNLINKALSVIPEPDKILREAFKALSLAEKPSQTILRNFEFYVSKLEATAFKIYQTYEMKAFDVLRDFWVKKNFKRMSHALRTGDPERLNRYLADFVRLIRSMEFRVGQKRRVRGGASFQKIVKILLNRAGVPCEEPHKETRAILKRIDLVSPDAQTAKETPDKAVFLATKRTLRERWKQVVPEHMKGARLYLITLDDECSERKADEIKETGMVVYVKDELKNRSHLRNKPWVRRLSNLPKDLRNTIPARKKFVNDYL
jgi:hypothetical protein